jgi:hypothetical protein
MADAALGEAQLNGLDGPKEAGSDARPYSYASQFGTCFVRLLMVAGLKEGCTEVSKVHQTALNLVYKQLRGKT